MKKYEFVYPYEKAIALQKILEGTQKSIWFIPKNMDEIFAKVSKNEKRIYLLHGAKYFQNAFRPIFVLRLKEENNKTVVAGYWRWNWFVYAWFGWAFYGFGFGVLSGIASGNYAELVPMVFIALLFGAFAGVATWVERYRMQMIFAHLKKYAIEQGEDI